jgi:hypothetical protein
MMQRQGFYPRGNVSRWRADRPYHVALEDVYLREHWFEIDALCKLNSLPLNATGETIHNEGTWRVYEFTWRPSLPVQHWTYRFTYKTGRLARRSAVPPKADNHRDGGDVRFVPDAEVRQRASDLDAGCI